MHAGFVCTARAEEKVSGVQLAQGVLGAALYWWAGPLSHSIFFRLSAGSLGFMMLSVLILIFVLSRSAFDDVTIKCCEPGAAVHLLMIS